MDEPQRVAVQGVSEAVDRVPVVDSSASGLWPSSVVVRSLVGERTRLLLDSSFQRESRTDYENRGGYLFGLRGLDFIDAVEASALQGRGGAAFPASIKLRAVRDAPGPRYLVANGEEGEPLSVKDRWLLRMRPHLVLDGLFRAADAIGAERAFVYVSAKSVRKAIHELDQMPISVEIVQVEPAYVAGEETAAVRAINGGPALPTDKPPRPFEAGVGGRPTLVSNVETLANLPFVDQIGPRDFANPESRMVDACGSILVTLSGSDRQPGLYEVALGSTLRDIIALAGGSDAGIHGALMGGYFAGLINARVLDLPLSYRALRAEGSGLGCGAIWLFGDDECPVQLAADVMHYFERNNARQCGPCLRGTSAMSAVLDRLAGSVATQDDMDRLAGWSLSLKGRGACAYLDGAANLPETLTREFSEHVAAHSGTTCPLAKPPPRDRLARLRLSLTK